MHYKVGIAAMSVLQLLSEAEVISHTFQYIAKLGDLRNIWMLVQAVKSSYYPLDTVLLSMLQTHCASGAPDRKSVV